MQNHRFIFTIDKRTKNYIARIARQNGISKSKAVKNILHEHISGTKLEKKSEAVFKSDNQLKLISHDELTHNYSTPDFSDILTKQNFLEHLSNEDVDFLIYTLDDYVNSNTYPEDQASIIYAKVLKHRGFFGKAISVLNSINDKFNIEKYLLLLSINISIGDIPKARSYLLKSTELLNLFKNDLIKFKGDYTVLKAEFIWIDEGVIQAHEFVKNYLRTPNIFNDNILGKLYCLEGEFLRDKGDYSQAKSVYNLALKYLQNYPYEGTYIARALKGLGSVYKNQGNFDCSSKYIFNALEISRKFADKITESGVLASIGSLYLAQNKNDLGIKMLQEKSDIGKRANSMREQFYANYDLGIATIEKGDYHSAQDVLEDSLDIGTKFKRRYYIDMWRGLIKSFDNIEEGVRIIEASKQDAIEANEDKRIYLADYLLAASYLNKAGYESKGKVILKNLINNSNVSKQLQNNSQILLKSPSTIKSI